MKQKVAKLEHQAHTLEQSVTRVTRTQHHEKARLDAHIDHQYGLGNVLASAISINSQRIDGVCNVMERAREPFQFMLNTAQKQVSKRRRSPSSNPKHPRAQGRLGGRFAIEAPSAEDVNDADDDDDDYVDIDDDADADPATSNWADASEGLQPAEDDDTYNVGEASSGGSNRRRRGKKAKKSSTKKLIH